MKYIGICGYAGAGKDLLCSLLIQKINAKRIGLADSLKAEARNLCLEKFGIDPVTCSREEKEIIRPTLIQYAKEKRLHSNGTYFTSKVDSLISRQNSDLFDYLIIPDIRYNVYPEDEVYWLKNKHNGILILVETEGVGAPNEEEVNNLPNVKKEVDFIISWPKFKKIDEESKIFVDNTIKYIYGRL
jgi:hypothetical protein